jgi:hypothetical protein
VRLWILRQFNPYCEFAGVLYLLEDEIVDPMTGIRTRVMKMGITNDIDRRRTEYEDCGDKTWRYYWDTDYARVTGECPKFSPFCTHCRQRRLSTAG